MRVKAGDRDMQKNILGLGVLKRLVEALGRSLAKKPSEVRSEAFRKALEPIKRRETPSAMGSTSRGRGWFPRRATYRPVQIPGTTLVKMLPRFGYELDWHGTIRRTAAKVNKCSRRRARAACAA
jgi:hypothetical protein